MSEKNTYFITTAIDEYVGVTPRPAPVAWTLVEDDAFAGTLEPALPMGRAMPYYANEAHAALWVHATLCHSAVLVYELVLPALTAAQKDRYWEEARHFAAHFGIRRPMLYPSELQARVPVAG